MNASKPQSQTRTSKMRLKTSKPQSQTRTSKMRLKTSKPQLSNHKFCIIVPFRNDADDNRKHQLIEFMKYMRHYFANIPTTMYKIYIIEQSNDGLKFNRGKILNIGFHIAQREYDYSHYIFNDVDLLPSKELYDYYVNTYNHPVHIANVWNARYNYKNYFGGVVSFTKSQYKKINGFPNNFWGWGGEDDELYLRTKDCKYNIIKPKKGKITDLENMTFDEKNKILRENEHKNLIKKELLNTHKTTWKTNGLRNLTYILINKKNIYSNITIYNVEL